MVSAWQEHLAKFRKSNPDLKGKDIMKQASISYKKTKPVKKPVVKKKLTADKTDAELKKEMNAILRKAKSKEKAVVKKKPKEKAIKIKDVFKVEGIQVKKINQEANYYDFVYIGKKDFNIKGKIQKDILYLDQLLRDTKTTNKGEIMPIFCALLIKLKSLNIMKDNFKIFVSAQADFDNSEATPNDQKKLVNYYQKMSFKITKRKNEMKTEMETTVKDFLLWCDK